MKHQFLILLCAIGLLLTAITASPSQIGALATQASTPAPPPDNCKRIHTQINQVEFSADGKSVLAVWEPGTARMWDSQTGTVIHTFGEKRNFYTQSATFSPDGKYVLMGEATSATLWDVMTGAKLRTFPRKVTDDPYGTRGRFSPDGKYVATDGFDGVSLWNTQSGGELHYFRDPDHDYSTQFSGDGKYLQTRSIWFVVRIWDVKTFNLAFEISPAFGGEFSPDSRFLVTNNRDGLHFWDTQTFKNVKTFGTGVEAWAISSDGKYLGTVDI